MINYRNVISIIKEEKDRQGLTLEMLSAKSGIARGTLNKLMSSSTKSIKMDHIAKLSNALDIPLSQLLEEEQTSDRQLPPYWGYVRIACCTPSLKATDCKYNADIIARHIRQLDSEKVNVAVFPELSVTGYTCGDLMFNRTLLDNATAQVLRLCNETADTNVLVAVGMPLSVKGRLYNCAVMFNKGKILAVVPKSYLPSYNEFYEGRYFAPAPENNDYIMLGDQRVLFGTKILLEDQLCRDLVVACEVCEDLWVADAPSNRHTAAGATAVLNLSASNESIGKSRYRCDMVKTQSAKCICAYAYCSCGPDESTSDTVFSAHNIISEYGNVLAQSELFENNTVMADIDVQFILNERNKLYNYRKLPEGYQTVYFSSQPDNTEILRKFDAHPFEADEQTCRLVLQMQAYALKKRLLHTHADKLVLGVSGGLDSTLALIACANALKLANRPLSDIVAITMPCFGTTKRTYDNSVALAQHYGATVMKIDISDSVKQHLADIGHNGNADVVLENAQARERTQILMDVANKVNGIVVGTGNCFGLVHLQRRSDVDVCGKLRHSQNIGQTTCKICGAVAGRQTQTNTHGYCRHSGKSRTVAPQQGKTSTKNRRYYRTVRIARLLSSQICQNVFYQRKNSQAGRRFVQRQILASGIGKVARCVYEAFLRTTVQAFRHA